MTIFLELKEKLKEIYAWYGSYILPAVKFFLALAVFQSIHHTLNYVPALGNIFIILILSLICAIIPLNGMVFFAMAMILLQCAGVHIVVAAFGAILLLALWVLYLRFASGEALALILTPLAFALKIPAAVPIAFGLVSGPVSAFSVACGLVVYYFMRLVHERIAVLAASGDVDMMELVKSLAEGVFQNEALLVALICCTVTLLVVNLIRTLEADYAWQISVIAGGVAYIVIQLAGALFLEVPVSIPVLLIGTVGACLICYVLQLFVFGGDYSRSRMFRFQDDEYYYYVKAIPKMAVSNPDHTIKNISGEETQDRDVPEKKENPEEENSSEQEREVLKSYAVSKRKEGQHNVQIPSVPSDGDAQEREKTPVGNPETIEETGKDDASEIPGASDVLEVPDASGDTEEAAMDQEQKQKEEQRKDEYFHSVNFEEKLTDTLKNL